MIQTIHSLTFDIVMKEIYLHCDSEANCICFQSAQFCSEVLNRYECPFAKMATRV